jgi:hypothetical protein
MIFNPCPLYTSNPLFIKVAREEILLHIASSAPSYSDRINHAMMTLVTYDLFCGRPDPVVCFCNEKERARETLFFAGCCRNFDRV